MIPKEVDMALEGTVQRCEKSQVLDTALYKNVPLHITYIHTYIMPVHGVGGSGGLDEPPF